MPETRIKSGFFNVFIKKNFSIFYLAFFLAGQSSPRAGGSLPPWPLTRDVSLDPSLGRCPSPRPPGAFAMWQREAARNLLPSRENVRVCEGVKGCPTASRFACPLTPAGARCYYRSDQCVMLSEGQRRSAFHPHTYQEYKNAFKMVQI